MVDVGRRAITVGVSQQERALINYGITSFLFGISIAFYNTVDLFYEVFYLFKNFLVLFNQPRLLLIQIGQISVIGWEIYKGAQIATYVVTLFNGNWTNYNSAHVRSFVND